MDDLIDLGIIRCYCNSENNNTHCHFLYLTFPRSDACRLLLATSHIHGVHVDIFSHIIQYFFCVFTFRLGDATDLHLSVAGAPTYLLHPLLIREALCVSNEGRDFPLPSLPLPFHGRLPPLFSSSNPQCPHLFHLSLPVVRLFFFSLAAQVIISTNRGGFVFCWGRTVRVCVRTHARVCVCGGRGGGSTHAVVSLQLWHFSSGWK